MKLPVVLFGGGDVANHIYFKLKNNGIDDIHFSVTKGSREKSGGISEEIDKELKEYILIPAFHEAYLSEINFDSFVNKKCVFWLGNIYENEVESIDKKFYLDNRERFEEVYNSLSDEKSKQCMKAFLEAKLTDDISCIRNLVERPQYFSGKFISMRNDECLVDCGAYNGDSIRDFLQAVNNRYSCVYAFEPDENNLQKLRKYIAVSHLENIKICPYGAYDEVTELHFISDEGMFSNINQNGKTVIKTETIDRVLDGRRATFIKMDIEGAEVKALMGAENTIKRYQPVLAISAYHKAGDIFEIYETINRLRVGYKFYFRLHKAFAIDAVLYAMPVERCIC